MIRPTVNTSASLERLERVLMAAPKMGFDTEFTDFSHEREAVGMSFAVKDGDRDLGFYVPMRHVRGTLFDPEPRNMEPEKVSRMLNRVFSREDLTVYSHNLKAELGILRREGVDPWEIKADCRCTFMQRYLLDPTSFKKSLEDAVREYFGYDMDGIDFKKIHPSHVPIPRMSRYAVDDVRYLIDLSDKQDEALKKINPRLIKIHRELENPMVFVTEEMENNGVLIDTSYLTELEEGLHKERVVLEGQISHMLRKAFCTYESKNLNLGSTQWISALFVDKLKWWGVHPWWERGGSGFYSTNSGALEEWRNGTPPGTTAEGRRVATLLIRHRALSKLLSTYTRSLMASTSSDGRIHCNFNQAGTATGRYSSNGPNLQNIPARSETGKLIRKAFIVPEDCKWVSADYSQVELRIMAHLSQDPTLVKAYKEGLDIHQITADSVGSSRADAKGINFGLIYGMGVDTLAGTIGSTREEAEAYHRKYFRKYIGVKKYHAKWFAECERTGKTLTLLGRHRFLPHIQGNAWGLKAGDQRVAINTRVQGSNADVIKVAMRNIRKRIKENGWRGGVKTIAQVHDELNYEIHEDLVEEAQAMIQYEMENAVKLTVPLVAEPSVGNNWSEAK